MKMNQRRPSDDLPRHSEPKKVIDLSSVILLAIGVISGFFAFHLTQTTDLNALAIVPSVVAATTGALNLTTIKGAR